jgi:hypothetical protein
MSEVLVVMVHVWQDMPDHPQVKWEEFSNRIVADTKMIDWPVVWQFDFIQTKVYSELMENSIKNKINSLDWNDNLQVSPHGLSPHSEIVYKDLDWISTGNKQTQMIVDHLDPKLVMFGGLHKDLCVKGVLLDIKTDAREYFVSDRLSYTWKETLYKEWTNSHDLPSA